MRIFVPLAIISIAAGMWPEPWIVGYACGRAAQPLFPNCSEMDAKCFCNNKEYLASVANCIHRHSRYNSTHISSSWDRFEISYCQIKDTELAEENVFSLDLQNPKEEVPDYNYRLAYKGQYINLRQKDTSAWLAGGVIFYWFAVMLIAAFHKTMLAASFRLADRRHAMKRPNALYRWLQRHFFMPALFRSRHMQQIKIGPFGFSLGTRFETVVILIYIGLCITFMIVPYTFMDEDPFFDSRWKEMMRYASDRSGIMATIHMPLFVLFGMRNNFMIWMTGWSFSVFNVYHRAIARVTFALLIVHAVTKHIFSASYGASLVKYFYPLMYYRYGVAAMGLFGLMIFVGSLRHKMYELFLWSHVLCAIGAIVMSIKHLDGIGYKQPLYACFIVWGVDILIRLGRIFAFNFAILAPPLRGSRRLTFGEARVYNRDTTNIVVYFPVRWKVYAGQYVYLHMGRWGLLGGHPFSVLGRSHTGDGLELLCKARDGFTRKLRDKLFNSGGDSKTPITIPIYVEGPYGVSAPIEHYDEALIVAGGVGITGVLPYVEKMCEEPGDIYERANFRSKRVTLLWTVPKEEDLRPVVGRLRKLSESTGNIIELYCRTTSRLTGAGGPKIQITSDESDAASQTTGEKTIDMSFADVKDLQSSSRDTTTEGPYYRVLPPTPAASKRPGRPPTTIYVNGVLVDAGSEKSRDSTSTFQDGIFDDRARDSETVDSLAHLIRSYRPNIPDITRQFFMRSQGSVAVVGCGPPRMMDSVARSVCDNMNLVLYGRCDYFEEAFNW